MNQGYAFAWMAGLMVAPHTLTVVGNIAGSHQGAFIFWIALAAIVYWINARSFTAASAHTATMPNGEMALIPRILYISSRWVTTITLSTVLLVTSGYSFNETFVYWFPNFAFAFILLGLLIMIHLLIPESARKIQLIMVAVAAAGLLALIMLGFWKVLAGELVYDVNRGSPWRSPPYSALLIFVGFDLILNHHGNAEARVMRGVINRGIPFIAVLLGLWGVVSFLTVPADRLVDSFIPHNIAARSIGGEMGRLIMGVVVITGSIAAVNALITAISQPNVSNSGHRQHHRGHWRNLFALPGARISIAGIGVGLMMALGFAGEDTIDTYIRSGLILWLLYYGTLQVTLFGPSRSLDGRTPNVPIHWWLPLMGAAAMYTCAGALIWTDPEKSTLIGATVLAIVIAALIAGLKRWISPRNGDERNGASHRPFGLSGLNTTDRRR